MSEENIVAALKKRKARVEELHEPTSKGSSSAKNNSQRRMFGGGSSSPKTVDRSSEQDGRKQIQKGIGTLDFSSHFC